MDQLTEGELRYLASAVRMRVRKTERSLERFAPKPGQSQEDVHAFRARLEDNLAWAEELLFKLYFMSKEQK